MQKYNRRIMFLTGLVIIFLLVFFRTRVTEKTTDVVATVGTEQITWADFIAFTSGIHTQIPDEERKSLLDRLVMQRLVELYVQRHPTLQDSLDERFAVERDYALRMLLQREVERYMVQESVLVTLQDIRLFYQQHDCMSLYSASISRLEPEPRLRAGLLRDSLMAGDWREILAAHTESGKLEDALMGYYVRDTYPYGSAGYIAQAESLRQEGDVSSPFQEDYRYILLVRGPTPTLEQMEPMLRAELEQRWTQRSESEFHTGVQQAYQIDEDLLRRAASGENIPSSAPVIRYRQTDHVVTWATFCTALDEMYQIDDPGMLAPARLIEMAHAVADQEKRLQLAQDLGLNGTLRFRLRWEGAKAALEAEQAAKTYSYVQSRMAPVSEEEMRAWFRAHQGMFRQPDYYQLQRVVLPSREQAQTVYKQAVAGADFDDLVRQHSQVQGFSRDGHTGLTTLLDQTALGAVYDSLATRSIGYIVPPVLANDDTWVVNRLYKRVVGAVRPYDEVQPYILRTLQMEKWQAWLADLGASDDLRVQMHYDVLLQKQFPAGRQRR